MRFCREVESEQEWSEYFLLSETLKNVQICRQTAIMISSYIPEISVSLSAMHTFGVRVAPRDTSHLLFALRFHADLPLSFRCLGPRIWWTSRLCTDACTFTPSWWVNPCRVWAWGWHLGLNKRLESCSSWRCCLEGSGCEPCVNVHRARKCLTWRGKEAGACRAGLIRVKTTQLLHTGHRNMRGCLLQLLQASGF